MNQNNISLETVLYALYGCSNVQSGFTGAVYVCPTCAYGKDDGRPCESLHPLLDDAYALLKAQEPHVMTPEELGKLQEDDVVYVEIKPILDITGISVELIRFVKEVQDPATWIELHTTDSIGFFETRKSTEPNWRCWTSKPTNKQRQETKWV